jgi:uncharacterized membrane protein
MPSATPFSLAIKAILLWVAVMLPTLITLVTRDYTVNIILLTVMFPIMLAFLVNMDKSPFIVKTSVIGVASMITFFVMYIIAKFVPKIQTALQDPGQNRGTTITIILLIAGIYSVAMGTAGYFLPMFPIQAMPGNMLGGNMRMPTY